MKPKTKKTLIIVLAIAAVAAIVWLAFFRKGKSASSIVDKLAVDDGVKSALKAKVAEIEANASGLSGWTRESIESKAAQNGYTYNQWLVVEAAYALYYSSNWALYDQIGTMLKTL